jgi:hypothetical protein
MLITFNENKVLFSHTIPFDERFILILQTLWVETLEGEANLAAAGRAEEDVVGEAEAFAADLECAAEAVDGGDVRLGPVVRLE